MNSSVGPMLLDVRWLLSSQVEMQKCYWIYKSGNRCRVLGKLEPSAQMVFKNRRPDCTTRDGQKKKRGGEGG